MRVGAIHAPMQLLKPVLARHQFEQMHASAPETKEAAVNEEGVSFQLITKLACLRLTIGFLIDDADDAKHRITKVSKEIGDLNFILRLKEIPSIVKIRLRA